jgi:hypothetical protein
MTSKPSPTPRPRRKHGGQPCNRNALKHALYAKYYPEETKNILLKWDVKDYIGEVHLLRASMDKLAEVLLVQKDIPAIEKVAMLNGIVRASNTVSLLVHRHNLLNTHDDPIYIAWDDTTRERDFFTDGKPPE